MKEERQRMTLAEMVARSSGTAGRLVCPKCDCRDFRTYKTQQGHASTFRYKMCRHCGHKFLTMQAAEQAIRDVETTDDDTEDSEGDIV